MLVKEQAAFEFVEQGKDSRITYYRCTVCGRDFFKSSALPTKIRCPHCKNQEGSE